MIQGHLILARRFAIILRETAAAVFAIKTHVILPISIPLIGCQFVETSSLPFILGKPTPAVRVKNA